MFSFHKPRVYRTSTGCCICKAKSSSSRFTDSLKYETEFRICFQLSAPRQGVICNACVLLVKRFKRLPIGSARNWGHVVDARAGPGVKCAKKTRKKHDELLASESIEKLAGDLHDMRHWGAKSDQESSEESSGSEDEGILRSIKRSPLLVHHQKAPRTQRKGYIPVKNKSSSVTLSTDLVDSSYWKREEVDCGVVWKGANSEILVDARLYTPRRDHRTPATESSEDAAMLLLKPCAEYSSDSGYDDCSNPAQMQILNI